ncbi:unnamed protein product [Prorocentrum cordatum]|uniref:Secreted protein n=1 Tax=Prorocentrum cordatum TaxID=2364126 RepID=A0ABN9S5I6_9DINO|nr:unnamed protein product [Polarella glacialis]
MLTQVVVVVVVAVVMSSVRLMKRHRAAPRTTGGAGCSTCSAHTERPESRCPRPVERPEWSISRKITRKESRGARAWGNQKLRVDIACRLARLPRPCRAGRAARAKFVIPLQAHGGKGPPSAVARGLESGCPLRLQGEPLGARRGEEGGGEEEEEEEDPIQEA